MNTYTKLRWRFGWRKEERKRRQTQLKQQVSQPLLPFFPPSPPSSRSENAPVKSPTTPGWANYGEGNSSSVFTRHLVQKAVIQLRLFFFLLHPESPLRVSDNLTRGKRRLSLFYRGVWSGFFSKKCEKCQGFFRCLCQSHRLPTVFKVSTLLQQRPSISAKQTKRPTSPCWINTKQLKINQHFNDNVRYFHPTKKKKHP